jgi:hypothetical protein
MKKIRVLIEVTCVDCDGRGKVDIHICDEQPIEGFECPGKDKCGETQTVNCSYCDGTGYQEESVSLGKFKELLRGDNE